MAASGPNPKKRNSLAGHSTGKSTSAKYFASHPEARAKKNAYNKVYHSSDERKNYRVELNASNRHDPNGKHQDKSHTKAGKLVDEIAHNNRARNGRGGTPKRK